MKIIRAGHLDSRQLKEIRALEAACRLHDRTALTCPTEEGCLSFLLYDKDTLLSAFFAIFNENDIGCSAFTLPSVRRRGYFTLLLEEVLKESEEYDLLFLADDACPDARGTLNAIGAELINREHIMELSLPAPDLKADGQTAVFFPAIRHSTEDTRYTITENETPAGFFHLIFQNTSVYFYGLEVYAPLRNRGLATRAMTALISSLSQMSQKRPNRIRLQVSGGNRPALSLYKKLGFKKAETLSYYLY